jgi:PAS domain-containing protein
MRTGQTSSRIVLYAGVLLVGVFTVFTARSIWDAWQARSGEARAEAVFDLVEQRTPVRPTDAPGAMAWLSLELDKYGRQLGDERARVYRSFAARSDRVPDELEPLVGAMRSDAAATPAAALTLTLKPPARSTNDVSLREEGLADVGGRTLVVTRPRSLGHAGPARGASDRFVSAIGTTIVAASRSIDEKLSARPLPVIPGDRPPRPVRVYAVGEDGTLVSAPWAETGEATEVAEARELALLAARPALPTFAPEEFFFRFDPGSAEAEAAYSGFYLDLGGRGLVSTILVPVAVPGVERGVLALDLGFEIDWRALAGAVDPPLVGAAVVLARAGAASWAALAGGLAPDGPATLRTALDALVSDDRLRSAPDDRAPLRHAVVEAAGAVAAFQVSDDTWLLMLFPRTSPAFPVAAVALLAGLVALVIGGFEVTRRRAEAAQRKAESAFREKQSLLETMQVPLVVVDPNTDAIVSSNRAAEVLGIRAGSRFADLVWPDTRARRHYERMQVASPEPRRAYGVPVGVRDERGKVVERYAIVRSVAVTAPIEALSADERHRLGVLFVLEPEADLALLSDDIAREAHRDERRRLAGLLSHGVDTLARVLEHCLSRRDAGEDMREFTSWLAEYLERRLTLTAWLVDHWDDAPPAGRDHVIDAGQARATLARFASILALVATDRELRSRLHWDNGTLSAASGGRRVLDVTIDWPPDYQVTCPVRGGFGFFLGEVLANAVRHGRPGDVPGVAVTCDRVRKELTFRVENATSALESEAPRGEPYGGLSIVRALARLFGWTDLAVVHRAARFTVSWRVPAGERGGGAD